MTCHHLPMWGWLYVVSSFCTQHSANQGHKGCGQRWVNSLVQHAYFTLTNWSSSLSSSLIILFNPPSYILGPFLPMFHYLNIKRVIPSFISEYPKHCYFWSLSDFHKTNFICCEFNTLVLLPTSEIWASSCVWDLQFHVIHTIFVGYIFFPLSSGLSFPYLATSSILEILSSCSSDELRVCCISSPGELALKSILGLKSLASKAFPEHALCEIIYNWASSVRGCCGILSWPRL